MDHQYQDLEQKLIPEEKDEKEEKVADAKRKAENLCRCIWILIGFILLITCPYLPDFSTKTRVETTPASPLFTRVAKSLYHGYTSFTYTYDTKVDMRHMIKNADRPYNQYDHVHASTSREDDKERLHLQLGCTTYSFHMDQFADFAFRETSGNKDILICMDSFTGTFKHRKEHPEQFGNPNPAFSILVSEFLMITKTQHTEIKIIPFIVDTTIGLQVLESKISHAEIPMFRTIRMDCNDAGFMYGLYMKLRTAWDLLESGGMVYGDHYQKEAVKHNIDLFLQHLRVDSLDWEFGIEQIKVNTPLYVETCKGEKENECWYIRK